MNDEEFKKGMKAEAEAERAAVEGESEEQQDTYEAFRKGLDEGKIFSLAEVPKPIPEELDRRCLFKHNWLRKGGVAMLVSLTGTGKSVMVMQMMCCWAAGKPAFGITPIRPLKIAYLESEDDVAELVEHRSGIERGLMAHEGWTEEEFADAIGRISILSAMKAGTGENLVEYLKKVQLEHKYDLIVMNPLQSFAGFDIQANEKMTAFARNGLDVVVKNPDTSCGLFIVHHTPKPPSDPRTRASFGTDVAGAYVGAGASDLANWLRAGLTLMPITRQSEKYYLTGVKGGDRLGWGEEAKKAGKMPQKIVAHSKGYLYWQTLNSVTDEVAGAAAGGDERPEVEIHAEFMASLVPNGEKGIVTTNLCTLAREKAEKAGMKMTKRQSEDAADYLKSHSEQYGIGTKAGHCNSTIFYRIS